MLSSDVLNLVTTLVVSLTSLVAAVVLPKLNALMTAKLGVDNAKLLTSLAEMAVQMTEQQLSAVPGSQKKAIAVSALKGLADSHKLKVNDASVHAAIEQAVLNLPRFLSGSFGSLISEPISAPAPAAASFPAITASGDAVIVVPASGGQPAQVL